MKTETAIEEETLTRERAAYLNATWQKIYDFAYRGDGACGFKAFRDALAEEYVRGEKEARSEWNDQ